MTHGGVGALTAETQISHSRCCSGFSRSWWRQQCHLGLSLALPGQLRSSLRRMTMKVQWYFMMDSLVPTDGEGDSNDSKAHSLQSTHLQALDPQGVFQKDLRGQGGNGQDSPFPHYFDHQLDLVSNLQILGHFNFRFHSPFVYQS